MPPADTRITRPATAVDNAPEFEAIVRQAHDRLEFIHITIFTWNDSRGSLTRLYSSDQDAYPVGGEKFMPLDAPWPQAVLIRQEPHCCWSVADIEATYNDSTAIRALGCTILICVPVAGPGGRTLGALNFLGKDGQMDHSTVAKMQALALQSVDPFLAWERNHLDDA